MFSLCWPQCGNVPWVVPRGLHTKQRGTPPPHLVSLRAKRVGGFFALFHQGTVFLTPDHNLKLHQITISSSKDASP